LAACGSAAVNVMQQPKKTWRKTSVFKGARLYKSALLLETRSAFSPDFRAIAKLKATIVQSASAHQMHITTKRFISDKGQTRDRLTQSCADWRGIEQIFTLSSISCNASSFRRRTNEKRHSFRWIL